MRKPITLADSNAVRNTIVIFLFLSQRHGKVEEWIPLPLATAPSTLENHPQRAFRAAYPSRARVVRVPPLTTDFLLFQALVESSATNT